METDLRTQKILRRRRLRINWPLVLGILLIGAVVFLAVNGPGLAPRDPLEENLIVRDEEDGEWHIPPFEAFAVTGFPLGSDEFGRDMLSRLLYAVRPTLQMVLVVAAVRLGLGTLIGLAAGWSTGRLGGFFDTLISGALALPGLLVALGAIAVVGVELGVVAFIIGLSLTGWAETARLVREQTRAIRSEVYVEAAHALGATDPQIVFRHVVRQIRAMLLMLFAFEIGSTLMLTAGLGFLGYYIGGDVWVDVDDFVARRTSGDPELGQMLATAWVRLTDPWGLVAVGSVVFSAVLGFNLIGEGLRLRMDPESTIGRVRWLSDGLAGLRLNLEQAWHPIGRLLFGSRIAVSLWMIAIGFGAGYAAVAAWQQGLIKLPEPQAGLFFDAPPTPTPFPTEAGAAGGSGSETAPAAPAAAEPTQSAAADRGWRFTTPDNLLIDPLVHPNGSVYLLTRAGTVHILDPDGSEQTVFDLPEPVYILEEQVFGGGAGVSTPFPPILSPDGAIVVASDTRLYAVGPDGTIRWETALDGVPHSPPLAGPDGVTYYQLDAQGSLYAFSPQDGLLWKHEVEENLRPAFFFPVISGAGEVYYSITNGSRGYVEAVGAAGEFRWRTELTTFNFYRPIQVTPAGDWISLDDNVIRTETGELVELIDPGFSIDQFIMGQDGHTYLLSGTTVMEWELAAGGRLSSVRQVTAAPPPNIQAGFPPVMRVAEDGTVWYQYFGSFGARTIYMWVDFDGTVWNILNVILANEFIIREDLAQTGLTLCSLVRAESHLVCRGFVKESAEPAWEVVVEGISRADSVQYRDGVLYIQTAADTVQTVPIELP